MKATYTAVEQKTTHIISIQPVSRLGFQEQQTGIVTHALSGPSYPYEYARSKSRHIFGSERHVSTD